MYFQMPYKMWHYVYCILLAILACQHFCFSNIGEIIQNKKIDETIQFISVNEWKMQYNTVYTCQD